MPRWAGRPAATASWNVPRGVCALRTTGRRARTRSVRGGRRRRGDRVNHRAARRRDEIRGAAIVGVDHADRAVGEDLEQPAFRGEVRFHVAVEVEVIARQVGEDAGRESQVVDAAQRQRVRRHFHDAGAAALLQHLPQHLLHVGRLRRGARGIELARADAIADRADAAALDTRGFEDRREHVRRRRLSVRAGDADEGEVFTGVAEERGRERGERPARAVGLNPWHGDAGRCGGLRDDGNRAVRDRLRTKRTPSA